MTFVACELGSLTLCSARPDDADGGGVNYRCVPCIYVEVTETDVPRLQAAGLAPAVSGGHYLVLGAEALTAMALLGVPLQRPLATGILAPTDEVGALALGVLLQQLLNPAHGDEMCFFSLPPPVLDSSGYDLATYRAQITRLLSLCGYTSRAQTTPLALLHSETLPPTAVTSPLAAPPVYPPSAWWLRSGPPAAVTLPTPAVETTPVAPTAVGAYFDLSLVSTGLYYEGRPQREFSLTTSGHWVDRNVALTLGISVESAHELRTRTEAPLDLTNPATDPDAVVALFVYSMLRQWLLRVATELSAVTTLPPSLPLLVGGAEAVGLHFIDVVRQVYLENRAALPLSFSEVKLAANPSLATVTGLLDQLRGASCCCPAI